MRRVFLLVVLVLLVVTVALAQNDNSPASGQASQSDSAANAAQYQNPDAATKSSPHPSSVIRGCLSGSSGNYTLTDQNGLQYQVAGDDATLRSMVGREVEINGVESQTSNVGADSNLANGVQASEVRAVSSTCKKGASVSAPPPVDHGADNPSQTNPDASPQPHNGAKPSSGSQENTSQPSPDRQ